MNSLLHQLSCASPGCMGCALDPLDQIDSLKQQLAEAQRDEHSACRRANRLAEQLLASEAHRAKLAEALEKIADPRKRDHKEPDAYTTLGCVMNIADVALASQPPNDVQATLEEVERLIATHGRHLPSVQGDCPGCLAGTKLRRLMGKSE